MTLRVCVVGALGRMGERVRDALAEQPGLELGGALEAPGSKGAGELLSPGVPVEVDPVRALAGCDVAIDFSIPKATLANLEVAADAGVAYVTGTTGFDEAGKARIAALANKVPVCHAANFSLSVNVLALLAREAARLLGDDFDAELFELHHAAKRDAPSGTALHLAEAIAEGRGQRLQDHVVLERAGDIGARPERAVGIQTLRGGDNPGEHTIYFIGPGERLELSHRSATRDHFARGAVRVAAWLPGQAPGLYPVTQALGL